jgi:ferritin-like metal-binding protein YciE
LGDRAQIVGANRRQLMAKEPKKLNELFHDTLKDIYFAEKKILSALPKMAKAAQDRRLKAAFEKHHTETETHVSRLEQVFGVIDAKPQGKICHAIWALSKRSTRALRHWMPAF